MGTKAKKIESSQIDTTRLDSVLLLIFQLDRSWRVIYKNILSY